MHAHVHMFSGPARRARCRESRGVGTLPRWRGLARCRALRPLAPLHRPLPSPSRPPFALPPRRRYILSVQKLFKEHEALWRDEVAPARASSWLLSIPSDSRGAMTMHDVAPARASTFGGRTFSYLLVPSRTFSHLLVPSRTFSPCEKREAGRGRESHMPLRTSLGFRASLGRFF